jgi:3-oxoacyl-[acyl-carrier protein] reductase
MSTIIITGGSRGLGLSIIRSLLNDTEFNVINVSRRASSDLKLLLGTSERLKHIDFDFTDVSNIYQLSKEISSMSDNIYGLINNAAIGGDGVLATQHLSDIENIINVNQVAPILMSKYIGRLMLKNRIGHIINISSVVATTGYSGLSVYASTKAALVGFTRSLSREYGKYGVCVNAVLPGFMKTDMTGAIGDDNLNKIAKRSPTKSLPSTFSVANLVKTILMTDDFSINGSEFVIDSGNSA